jgi:hypothetical protein
VSDLCRILGARYCALRPLPHPEAEKRKEGISEGEERKKIKGGWRTKGEKVRRRSGSGSREVGEKK